MNQAIQVLDGCIYIDTKEAIKVDFMASGRILICYICGSGKKGLISLYKSKQFEIEEMIEQQLDLDKINSDGEIWLTADEVNAY